MACGFFYEKPDWGQNAQEKLSYFIYYIHCNSLVFSFILWYNYMNIIMSIFYSEIYIQKGRANVYGAA